MRDTVYICLRIVLQASSEFVQIYILLCLAGLGDLPKLKDIFLPDSLQIKIYGRPTSHRFLVKRDIVAQTPSRAGAKVSAILQGGFLRCCVQMFRVNEMARRAETGAARAGRDETLRFASVDLYGLVLSPHGTVHNLFGDRQQSTAKLRNPQPRVPGFS